MERWCAPPRRARRFSATGQPFRSSALRFRIFTTRELGMAPVCEVRSTIVGAKAVRFGVGVAVSGRKRRRRRRNYQR